jgi:hypothetical protein
MLDKTIEEKLYFLLNRYIVLSNISLLHSIGYESLTICCKIDSIEQLVAHSVGIDFVNWQAQDSLALCFFNATRYHQIYHRR